ncbi:MAG: MFS transporter [Actinomycetes bacterium]
MRELLRHRDFRLLMIGQTLSMFGDTAMLLTLGMWAKDLTGSNAVAGSVFVALGLPTLLAPFGGLLIDRFRRRHLMIVVDLVTAVALLGLLAVHDRSDLWVIYAVAAIYGASLVVFQSARSALLHSMLPERALGQANGSLSTVREALRLIGPAAGAGLYAWLGGQATAVLDAATFVVSALVLLAMRVPEPKPTPTMGEPFTTQLSTGLRHIRRTPILRVAVVCVVTAMLALGLAESVFFAVIDEGLHKPVTFLGILQTAMGVGAIAGGLLITTLIPRTGELRPVAAGLGLVALGAALCLVPNALVVAAAMLVIGAGLPVTVVCITTLLQRHTPAAIQGRVFTTFETLTGVPQVASIAAGAALVGIVDFHLLLTVMAVGLGLAAVYAFVKLREPAGAAGTSDLADLPVLDHEPAIGLHPFEQPTVVADQ